MIQVRNEHELEASQELAQLVNFLATKKSIKVLNVSQRYDLRNNVMRNNKFVNINFRKLAARIARLLATVESSIKTLHLLLYEDGDVEEGGEEEDADEKMQQLEDLVKALNQAPIQTLHMVNIEIT